jgi:hypothetical protein
MTERTVHGGKPNCGKTVLATSIASHAPPPYQAAARKTCRRRSSAISDIKRPVTPYDPEHRETATLVNGRSSGTSSGSQPGAARAHGVLALGRRP